MKKTIYLTFGILILLFNSLAFSLERDTLNDLQSLELRVEKKDLMTTVHYPNYRMGGGNGPSRQIVDCFILDILDSDNQLDLVQKMNIAEKIKVNQGFSDVTTSKEITPEIKGNNIVFKTDGILYYVIQFFITTRDERNLKEVLDEILPSTKPGNALTRVNLLYVRDCRF